MRSKNIVILSIITTVAVLSLPIIATLTYGVENRPPVVSNVHAEQRSGTKLVDITYDVEDPDGDTLTISVEISDDGGQTFTVPAKTFSGDIGSGIEPGTNKHIVWDAGKDVPEVYGTNYRAKVIATDGVPAEGEIIGKDGVPMVLIPAGEFEMGDHFNEGSSNERPVHTVYLDAFYIDKYEVTVGQYKKFISETGHRALPDWVPEYSPTDEHPVVGVSWHDAVAYAEWAGKRLPTEAEWEKAARGGLVDKRYPWGDEAPDAGGKYRANYDPGDNDADGYEYTAPVGSFPPNGYGLYDMAGNVWEWCADWYDSNYYSNSPRENPRGPSTGSSRVVRGGSWYYSPGYLRVAYRYYRDPTLTYGHLGFRCSAGLTP